MSDTPVSQPDLPLSLPDSARDMPLLPARMLNEYQYCPRLAYLEWVQGEWADSADTVEGRHVHRRVDQPAGDLPSGQGVPAENKFRARSITLSSSELGVIAKIDLLEADDGCVVPIDYKRGRRPHVAGGAYDPERVQLCAQAMVLEEHGYRVREAALYFAGSRERVRISIDDDLRAKTLNAIHGLRLIAAGGTVPPPLVDSPKCPRCSLVGICLPDEVNFLKREETQPRPLVVGRDEAMPVYVQAQHAKVSKVGETLEIAVEGETPVTARLAEVSQLVLMGNVYLTTPALHALMERDITVSWHTHGGWFVGHTVGTGHRNVELRTAQYRASFDEARCLRVARGLVIAKIQNARTLLRRNWKAGDVPESLLDEFRRDIDQARRVGSMSELLGVEGNAAARYFRHFAKMLNADGDEPMPAFEFEKRNRRPPTDPVNALLSFAYALLVRTWTVNLSAVGFDPYRGFYHQPRYGRPALALDLMEPFRPLVADSSVIQAINNGEIKPKHFVRAAGSVALNPDGRKRFVATFERRLSQEVVHPIFGYRVSYRRLLELQPRLFGRYLLGELDDYPNFVTR